MWVTAECSDPRSKVSRTTSGRAGREIQIRALPAPSRLLLLEEHGRPLVSKCCLASNNSDWRLRADGYRGGKMGRGYELVPVKEEREPAERESDSSFQH